MRQLAPAEATKMLPPRAAELLRKVGAGGRYFELYAARNYFERPLFNLSATAIHVRDDGTIPSTNKTAAAAAAAEVSGAPVADTHVEQREQEHAEGELESSESAAAAAATAAALPPPLRYVQCAYEVRAVPPEAPRIAVVISGAACACAWPARPTQRHPARHPR
jgi:hypothetical protein